MAAAYCLLMLIIVPQSAMTFVIPDLIGNPGRSQFEEGEKSCQ
jgi:hypothetical protein